MVYICNLNKTNNMDYEKIIKREDGSRVSITVRLHIERFRQSFEYVIDVASCEKSKRTWYYIKPDNIFDYVSNDEILQAKMELWESIKPI